jgi:hypothetical protein
MSLLDVDPTWKEAWKAMPDFHQNNLEPWQQIIVSFKNREDRNVFAKLINQPLTDDTRSLWYPKAEACSYMDKRFVAETKLLPRYPVYVISKGRWETRLTSIALEKCGIPYHIVIEPQELEQYAAVIDPAKILVLPFSNLGQGSIPARNWVWEHAKALGVRRHWILDDNIRAFYRLYNNMKVPVTDGHTFLAAEDFVDRYDNVALAGMQYFMFAPRKTVIPPFTMNTRIYSCILIDNSIPYRWRGRYNEDTDLSIRALKDGWCTVLFNAFLCDKQTTMTMKGGNTEALYKLDGVDGRLLMAKSLQEQHPDIVRIVEKWGRFQHHVHYRIFRGNKLIPSAGVVVSDETNNYGAQYQVDATPPDGSNPEPMPAIPAAPESTPVPVEQTQQIAANDNPF